MPTIAINHPAAMTADQARRAVVTDRRWRLMQQPGNKPVTLQPMKGWEPLSMQLHLDPGTYLLSAGPPSRGVSARFKVTHGGVVQLTGCARLAAQVVPVAQLAQDQLDATPPRAPRTTGAELQVSDIARQRIEDHEAHLLGHGIALPPGLYTHGTRVVALGWSNLRASRLAFEDTPRTIEGLEGVRDAIRSEDRQDILVGSRGDIRMTPEGSLQLGGAHGDTLWLEEASLRGLASLFSDALPSAGRLLKVLPSDERAELVNRQIQRSDLGNNPIKLRTRLVEGRRQVFALVGPNYGVCDGDQLADMMMGALREAGHQNARGDVYYNPTTTNIRAGAMFHADPDLMQDLACGDVFQAGYELRGNDAGGQSVELWGRALRNLCINLIILGRVGVPLVRVQHRGSTLKVQEAIRDAIGTAQAAFHPFAQQWGALQRTELAETSHQGVLDVLAVARDKGQDVGDVATVRSVYEAIVDSKLAGADWPVKRDIMVEMMLRGWQAEPGTSLASIVNGITRVHEEATLDYVQLQRVEQSAQVVMDALQ